jgi:hypothetical protein
MDGHEILPEADVLNANMLRISLRREPSMENRNLRRPVFGSQNQLPEQIAEDKVKLTPRKAK